MNADEYFHDNDGDERAKRKLWRGGNELGEEAWRMKAVGVACFATRQRRVSSQLVPRGRQVSPGNKVTADWINLRTRARR